MTSPTPYVLFPGTAREALTFYAEVFSGVARVHTLAEFGRTDGPADAVAHGWLEGPVALFGADATSPDAAVVCQGVMLSLLGTADPATLTGWFDGLAEGGRIIDPLQPRPWGDSDGQVVDRYGLHWLIGFQGETSA